MTPDFQPTSSGTPSEPQALLVEFLRGRFAPCPQCGHDLCDLKSAKCPECGEPLVLKVGSPRARFGWLVLAMAPGCFSGVAACFVMIPVVGMLLQGIPPSQGVPWPLIGADAFGFLSGLSVAVMYRHRHRIMSWNVRRQVQFVGSVWAAHFVALGLVIFTAWFFNF